MSLSKTQPMYRGPLISELEQAVRSGSQETRVRTLRRITDLFLGTKERLSEEQIEAIAEKAADRAVKKLTDQVYREVGRGIISKFVWLVGATSIGVVLWLNAKGIITFK